MEAIDIESFVEDEVRPVTRGARRLTKPARARRRGELEPRSAVVHRLDLDERRAVAQREHDRFEAAQVRAQFDVDANH